MTFDFKGKNVVITGGSRGIGKACALLFAQAGANVIITYNTGSEAAMQTLAELHPAEHSAWQLNVADAQAVAQFYTQVQTQYNGLDILVNNAGVYLSNKIKEADYADWQQSWDSTLQANLMGPANMCYFASRQMMERGGGKIVNISSRGAFRGEPEHPAYAASKAGLNAMSQSLAIALAPHNISVHIVAPGYVETDMASAVLNSAEGEAIKQQSPFGRVARPEEVARVVAVYASQGMEFTSAGIVDINGASYLRG